jgi:S1-C subfamily serine protease
VLEIMSVDCPMWEACVQKSRLTPLGMKTKDIPDSSSVMVVEIVPNSPLAKFNKETKQQAIEVGDVITSCNGATSLDEIAASTHPTHAGKQRTYYLGEIISRVGDAAVLKVARQAK